MKTALTVFLLQLAGTVAIIAECIIPSFGLITIAAGALFLLSTHLVFAKVSAGAGFILVAADLFLIPAAVFFGLKLLARSPATLTKQLKKEDGASSHPESFACLMGVKGKALTHLRPSGTALLEGRRVDVITRGEYIEQESSIEVIAVAANRVTVRQITYETN